MIRSTGIVTQDESRCMADAERAYLLPPEEPKMRSYAPRGSETLAIHFEIPFEPDYECDFLGDVCECDVCSAEGIEPLELCKGMTVFKLDGKLIYCDHLGGYLLMRKKTL